MSEALPFVLLPVALFVLAAFAHTAWRRPSDLPGADRLAIVASGFEAVAVLLVARATVPWLTVAAPLAYAAWGVCILVLALGVAGAAVRWPDLPSLPAHQRRKNIAVSATGIAISALLGLIVAI